MSAAIDRYKAAFAAVREHEDPSIAAAVEAWEALPLRSKLRVLIEDVTRSIGRAVWEIRLAAGNRR